MHPDEAMPAFEGKVEVNEREWDDNQIGAYAAILWVPDPAMRIGWREYWVRRTGARAERKPNGRAMGF